MATRVTMKSVVCSAALISVVSALYQPRPFHYGPTHPGAFGGAGSHGGGVDPLTLLLLQKNGGTGGINNLLPLLLTSGGLGGKKGINPLLLTTLIGHGDEKCVEKYPSGCTQPTTANTSPTGYSAYKTLCGVGPSTGCGSGGGYAQCCPCCTCPDTKPAPNSYCE